MDKLDTNTHKTEDRRRPYTKPAILTGEVFETMALSCGSNSPTACGPFATLNS